MPCDLVDNFSDEFASEVYKNYLYTVSRIIRANGDTITAFDVDRVWTRRRGQVVPDTEDVTMGNEAVDLDAVVLYADLKDSTVMAVYIGKNKNTAAAKTALRISWAVKDIPQPAIDGQYRSSGYKLRQKVGIASSMTMVSRTGIRGSNDLVWVGNAANFAAKLAAFDRGYSTYITEQVYDRLHESSKFGGDPSKDMWTDLGPINNYGRIYASSWVWSFA